VRDTVVLLAVAWLVPIVVHLAPWSGERPLGAHLLPMFWATLVAAYLFGARLGVLVGLFAPVVNLLFTGLPAWKFLSVLSVELTIFALIVAAGARRWPRFWFLAPLAYLAAKTATTALQAAVGVFGDIGAPLAFFAQSVVGGAAGLVVLLGLHAVLVRLYPKTATPAA
jgi:uncharacterized membrane protein